MKSKLSQFSVVTEDKYQLVDITEMVEKIILENEVKNGLVLVFVAHSTAAVLLTENEQGLKRDWLDFLKKLVSGSKFKHDLIDDNADSHIISGLLGQGKTLPIENGRMIRGTWQQIFLAELDGPKSRKVFIRVVGL